MPTLGGAEAEDEAEEHCSPRLGAHSQLALVSLGKSLSLSKTEFPHYKIGMLNQVISRRPQTQVGKGCLSVQKNP